MQAQRRRKALPLALLVRVGLVWSGLSALLLVLNWDAIVAQRLPGTDDAMRLVQVRDWLAGQSWFDTTHSRVDAPGGGVSTPWSRLVDLPLALVALVLAPVVGSAMAQAVAVTLIPLITLGMVMVLAARIAWKMVGEEEATLTALIVALCVPVILQLSPMRIDHHGWQLVCALFAMNGLMARSEAIGGRVIGASLAVWLMISLEGAPFAAGLLVLLGVRWLRNRRERALLVNAIQTLALTATGLFVATRGVSDFSIYCDAISPVHLAVLLWAALVLSVLSRLEPVPLAVSMGGFVVAGSGAATLVLIFAPQCAVGGAIASVPAPDPLVHDLWFASVAEERPIWQQSFAAALQYAITPLFGLFASLHLVAKSRDWLRQFWSDYAMILFLTFVLALFAARAGALACLLSAPPLAWQLNRWLRAIRLIERPAPRMGALLALACGLLPVLPFSLAALALPAQASSAQASSGEASSGAGTSVGRAQAPCRMDPNASILKMLPSAEVFAPIEIGPDLLLASDHTVAATGHHTGSQAIGFVIATWLGSSQQAEADLRARGTQYVAVCPHLDEMHRYAAAAQDGFAADLQNGRVPDWLEPVQTEQASSLKLWRIAPLAGGN